MITSNSDYLDECVTRTAGCSGADIDNICREAGMIAIREDLQCTGLSMDHLRAALDQAHR